MKNWFLSFFTSSIGKKLLMALTGLFLILFLLVHLVGNLQLLKNDGGESFNIYADFMGHNPLIQFISKANFFFILLHAVIGIMLKRQNVAARGKAGYAVNRTRATQTNATFAKYMAFWGMIIFIFLIVHLAQFWVVMKFGTVGVNVETVNIGGRDVRDLFSVVSETFMSLGFVIFYVLCMLAVSFHLWHGFYSAFQTIGWSHPKYTPVIQFLSKAYAVLIPLGFAIIPLIFYFKNV